MSSRTISLQATAFCILSLTSIIVTVALYVPRPQQIPPASVGVKFNANSGYSEKLIRPQVVWANYWERVVTYNTSIRNATYARKTGEGEKNSEDSVKASTSEGAILPVDVTVSYHVERPNVLLAFQNFGTDNLDNIQHEYIRYITSYGVSVVTGQRSIFDVVSKQRSQVGRDVKDVIAPILGRWGITVDDVLIGEVYPDDAIQGKINERLQVQTALDTSRTNLQTAMIQASTASIDASKQAELNKLLQEGNDQVVKLRRIQLKQEAARKWNGVTQIVGDDRIPFTDISASDLEETRQAMLQHSDKKR